MYSVKVNQDGSYRDDFYGYTVLAMVDGNFKWIEQFLKDSPLSEFYSPLPADSYHMTVYNVWCNYSNFLPPVQRLVGKNPKRPAFNYFFDAPMANGQGFFENLCMNVENWCAQENWDGFYVNPVELSANGTLVISVKVSPDYLNKVKMVREKCVQWCEKADPLNFHVTLAYKYKAVPPEMVSQLQNELFRLNNMVKHVSFKLCAPNAYRFNSMVNFVPNKFFYT